ncbi:MAG: hypothetical protein ABR63_03275 [SAR86 cluster bacterium BACL1 MAG-120920-bin57]|nr:MAG: hypothetical protein ABR63_03275 [SAR86 cluster bacterium BACL1 MAG-120920-bin57]
MTSSALHQSNAMRTVEKFQGILNAHLQNIQHHINNALVKKMFAIKNLSTNLTAVSPLAVLDRGYAIVTDASGKALTSSDHIKVGDTIYARLAKGKIISNVTKKE